MVKSYLRYEAGAVFGLVVSPAAHPAALFDTAHGPRRAIAATGENVVTWDLKRGQQVRPRAPASSLRTPPFLLSSSSSCAWVPCTRALSRAPPFLLSSRPIRFVKHASPALCTLSAPRPSRYPLHLTALGSRALCALADPRPARSPLRPPALGSRALSTLSAPRPFLSISLTIALSCALLCV